MHMVNEARKTIQKQTEKCNKEIKKSRKKTKHEFLSCKNFNRKNLQEDLIEQRNL